ncbi:hypothetical protein ONE63_005999 [Megalurothrips usitatus]|uniref:C2H2-type domain-containing protein n=1 Tax=Megalurothrips usitatus TaxID=439358 RepID=A0AAV7XZH2_9NEOP|nr:hypothetical protein ONE63_005999 [Megalurothrips usitatus]
MARGKRRSKKQQHAAIQPEGEEAKTKHPEQTRSRGVEGDKSEAQLNKGTSNGLKKCDSLSNMNTEGGSAGHECPDGSCLCEDAKENHLDLSKLEVHSSEAAVVHLNGFDEVKSEAMCNYCAMTFENQLGLKLHCQTEAHQIVVMSDGGRNWKYRPPPRGFTSVDYTLCENWDKTCKYGAQCVEAHSTMELQEWRKRFEYRHSKIQQAEQQNLLAKSYTEQLLEKWSHTSNPDSILKEKVDYAEDAVTENQLTTTISKDCKTDWTFLIRTTKTLRAVALLQFADRNRFTIKCVKSVVSGQHIEWQLEDTNEWLLPEGTRTELENFQRQKPNTEFKHSVCVEFLSDIYGTFRQAVAFDFGVEPLMVKHLCVDVRPASFATNVEELKKELFMDERWDENNAEIIKYTSPEGIPYHCMPSGTEGLLGQYPTPTPSTFTLTQSTVTERMATKNNYCSRMHELLGVEEMARYQQVARYNVRAKLSITKSYLLAPAGVAHSTAKFAQNDHLYAVMKLSEALSEDTAAGRLILNSCTSVLLCAAGSTSTTSACSKDSDEETKQPKKKVFEALIEDKGKNVIYLKLSRDTVMEYDISGKAEFHAEVQFQLNRLQYCEWHKAVDSIMDYKILFPETFLEPDIPWSPQRQWKEIKDAKLNVKQKEAIVAITTPLSVNLPPVLIIGPFGTGKTYTLAQAIKQLLTVPDYRVLVCTHSNSAADIYIQDYLHPYVLNGHGDVRPLRIYYDKRWVSTVNPTVQQYCLIEIDQTGTKRFRLPQKKDILKHRVVVVTLNMSTILTTLDLEKGFFTHIFLDEAAQAMECEAIMPLAMAGERTRIVLAGDHMQLNPELFSPFAKERNLHMSLLERLYDHYPPSFPCKILLTENYRAHEAILKFTSDLFYDQKLVCSGKQPKHPKHYPLTFYSCRGEDVQGINSTGHYNLAEVYEIAERVSELRKSWPAEWGELNEQSIGILTPYADQVFRIRCELRRKKLGFISVERVLNVQGKQFRAVFISTVRTRRTCSSSKGGGNEESEFGFLSNSKLLNTAITRAQSLVAVVGDPIALCSLGKCRKVWERYIQTCDKNSSLHGIPWSTIQVHLDGVEFRQTYGLNPLAPEFFPMGYNHRAVPPPDSSDGMRPADNDSYVLKGYQSHLSFCDQNSPERYKPASSFQANFYGSGPGTLSPLVDGQIEHSTYHTLHTENNHQHPHHQQPFGMYQVPPQTWPVQSDNQYRPPAVQNPGQQGQAYLISTCKYQSTPEMIQPSASLCSPNGSLHFMPHSPRVWQGGASQATNSHTPVNAGGKLILQVPAIPGPNSNNAAAVPLQQVPGSGIQHIEVMPFHLRSLILTSTCIL